MNERPERPGYYWLVMDKLRVHVVLVNGDRFWVAGKLRSTKISSLTPPYEFHGPLEFTRTGLIAAPDEKCDNALEIVVLNS